MRYGVVAVGGTFDIIHSGHAKLLAKAFEVGRSVAIGLTTDDLAKSLGKKGIRSYTNRKQGLAKYLKENLRDRKAKIIPLRDPLGPSRYDENIEALVVSEETFQRGVDANFERRKKGIEPLAIFTVPLAKAEDSGPISSTRIRAGEIDVEGRLTEKSRLQLHSKAVAR